MKVNYLLFLLASILCLCLIPAGCRMPGAGKYIVDQLDTEEPPIFPGGESTYGKKSPPSAMTFTEDGEWSERTERHTRRMEKVTGKRPIAGNKATLLIDGPETFSAMEEAIEGAKDHINLETFIFREDSLGRRFSRLLLRKRAEGVEVNIIYDSYGAKYTPPRFFARLRDGGIRVVEYNPVDPIDLLGKETINNRDHRKILIVDGKVAFTGGINIQQDHWRDTDIRIEGPAVASLQKLFIETWKSRNGPEFGAGDYSPQLEKEGEIPVHVIEGAPGQKTPEIYTAYLSAILNAEKTIHITHAYLVPTDEMLNALALAAEKGIDVKIIVPSFSDFWLPFYAGRHNYTFLLKAGVKLYELQGALLHSKTAVIDGVWSTIGSSNLDVRSFIHDLEVNAVIIDRDFGIRMETAFARDLKSSREILLYEWETRPRSDRLKEWFASFFKYWL